MSSSPRHPSFDATPPLSPTTSPHPPSSSSTSTSSLSLPLHDIMRQDNLYSPERTLDTASASQATLHTKLTLLPEQLDEDAVMLDDWSDDEQVSESEPESPRPPPLSSSRPSLPHRTTSYSKRHSSVDTPREVPFPYPLASAPSHTVPRPASVSFPRSPSHPQPDPEPQASSSARSSSVPSSDDVIDVAKLARQDQPPAYEKGDRPGSRPSSRPPFVTRNSRPLPAVPRRAGETSSSSSTPSPLERSSGDPTPSSSSRESSDSPHQSQAPSNSPIFPFGRPFSAPGNVVLPVVPPGRLQAADPAADNWYDRNSTASLPLPLQTPYHTLPSVRSTLDLNQGDAHRGSDAAPQPSRSELAVPVLPSSASVISSISYAPPPPYSATAPLPQHNGSSATLLSRSVSDYFPAVTAPQPARASPVQPSRLPPPAPPTILAPSAPPGDDRNHRAPHEPFLDAPPPADSWIAVETVPSEYTLVVRLPGFKRDGITLATRRRRILHLVADSWEAGGGHFERRISFGYDADLGQVRAEFDGELLRVIVPRRAPSVTWYGEARE